MTKHIKVLDASQSPVPPYLFQDLDELPADSIELTSRVTAMWRQLFSENNFEAVIQGIFQKYCKVRTFSSPELLVKRKSGDHSKIRITESPFSIGRKKGNHLELPEMGVSGKHAQIRKEGSQWVLMDEGSANGTALNGKWIVKKRAYPFENGDVINIMDTEMVIRLPKPTVQSPHFNVSLSFLGRHGEYPSESNLTEAVIGVVGGAQKISIYIPTALVRFWLESTVRIWYAQDTLNIPLSDVEKGLYEFLLLKLLLELHGSILKKDTESFYLDAIHSPARDFNTMESSVTARFLCHCEQESGDIFVMLPDPASEGLSEVWGSETSTSPNQPNILRSLIQPWKWVSFSLAVMIAGIDLSPAELMSLEHGDVVLLPEDSPRFNDDGRLTGQVALLFHGAGQLRGKAKLVYEEEEYRLIFQEFFEHQTPGGEMETNNQEMETNNQEMETNNQEKETNNQEKENQTDNAQSPEDNLDASGELLKDLSLSMVVELDRIQLTLDELVTLLPGQVVQLNRLPTEPISLSVDGKVIGKGQLVKIKDELGVKILTLKK